MSEIPFREPGRRTPATLPFTLLLGLNTNAIAADWRSLPGTVIEVPTPPAPIPAQGRNAVDILDHLERMPAR